MPRRFILETNVAATGAALPFPFSSLVSCHPLLLLLLLLVPPYYPGLGYAPFIFLNGFKKPVYKIGKALLHNICTPSHPMKKVCLAGLPPCSPHPPPHPRARPGTCVLSPPLTAPARVVGGGLYQKEAMSCLHRGIETPHSPCAPHPVSSSPLSPLARDADARTRAESDPCEGGGRRSQGHGQDNGQYHAAGVPARARWCDARDILVGPPALA